MSRKVLVAVDAGYAGSHAVGAPVDRGHAVVAFDGLRPPRTATA